MQRRHEMPFGATLMEDGTVRFRLWAPGAQRVDLCLAQGDSESVLPMQALAQGWYERQERAAAGARYRYRINGDLKVPDPASRFNPDDVHAASEVIAPLDFVWHDADWRGRPWTEAVIYELHVGSFSPSGDFAGVAARLDYLCELGVTALELMPIADFPGTRNWGYDGVLQYAPDAAYGRPEDLKRLIDSAHSKNLMVFLDVVYNHFGPDGNYLHCYAPQFFTERHHTPWGAAINFDGAGSAQVREFFMHNALYWLEEFHFDGLRLDAVHAIADDSRPDIVQELSARVRAGPGSQRAVHLMLENVNNQAHYLPPRGDATAQWNDDIHHALHVLLTGERDGYYQDYADAPLHHLGRCLAQGFAYQGEISHYRGSARGEPSGHLPAGACVGFLQNHDQIGNRAFGERLTQLASAPALHAAVAILLLAPAIPMLFMGEEFAASSPFPFFCDFHGDLAAAVTQGRRNEFARFAQFADAQRRAQIPDPNALATWQSARLDWASLTQGAHAQFLALYKELLALRRSTIWPLIPQLKTGAAQFQLGSDDSLRVDWPLQDGGALVLLLSLSGALESLPAHSGVTQIYRSPPHSGSWSLAWLRLSEASL